MELVLSLFPGIGLLDMAFEQEGFCVVRGPDVAHMVRHNGHKPKFGDLIPEFERVTKEAAPSWFLMENVKQAPEPRIAGYGVHSFILNNRQCVDEAGKPAVQNRSRRISFGLRGDRRPLLLDIGLWESPEMEYAACGGTHGIGGIGREEMAKAHRRKTGRNVTLNDCVGFNVKSRDSLARLCELQGLPRDFLKDAPFTVSAACKAIGNGVPQPMARALARAVREATEGKRA